MKKITRWSPDTCGCVIDFEWDTNDPQAPPVGKTVVSACEAHALKPASEHHEVILKENREKNIAMNKIAELSDDHAVIGPNGDRRPNPEKLSFSFNPDRSLNIHIKGASAKVKDDLSIAIDPKVKLVDG